MQESTETRDAYRETEKLHCVRPLALSVNIVHFFPAPFQRFQPRLKDERPPPPLASFPL